MGYSQSVEGHVGSVAHGVTASNAQRVPVRIYIDDAPKGVRLVAGMIEFVRKPGSHSETGRPFFGPTGDNRHWWSTSKAARCSLERRCSDRSAANVAAMPASAQMSARGQAADRSADV